MNILTKQRVRRTLIRMKIGQFSLRRWWANATLLAVTAVWGATFTLTRGALTHIPVFPYLSLRFVIAAAALVLIALTTGARYNAFHRRTFVSGAVLGSVLFGGYAFQTLALQDVAPSTAAFLTGLSVVLVPVLGVPLLKTVIPVRVFAGSLVALTGLGLLCGPDLWQLAAGDIDLLSCAVFIALQVLLVEKYGRSENALALATVEVTVMAVLSTGISVLLNPVAAYTAMWHRPSVFWAIIICALPATSFAYWAQNIFQQYTSSAETAIIFAAEPVFAAFIAWSFGGDTLTPAELAGAVLIFISMLLAEPSLRLWRRRKPA